MNKTCGSCQEILPKQLMPCQTSVHTLSSSSFSEFFIKTYSCKLSNPPGCSLVSIPRVQAEQLKMLNVKGENERKD